MRHDANEIARTLAARIESLCRELLPAGRRIGAEWVAPSLWGGSARGLSIRLTGTKSGIWADFSGDQRGDALDLAAHVRFGGDRRAALSWARGWLGLGDGATTAAARPSVLPAATPPPAEAGALDADAERRRRRGLAIFLAARPISGTVAELYLRGRRIELRELGRAPGALRFHPAVWCGEAKAALPCLVAAVTAPAGGGFLALHRTWLAQDATGIWRKAKLRTPKMALGSFAGGCIPLWRGASGKPLAKAGAGETTVISEGIENALTIAVACPHYRVLAAISVSNLGRLVLSPALTDLILCSDGDADGSAAAVAFERAVDRLLAEGRSVRIARSSSGGDFNDALMGAAS